MSLEVILQGGGRRTAPATHDGRAGGKTAVGLGGPKGCAFLRNTAESPAAPSRPQPKLNSGVQVLRSQSWMRYVYALCIMSSLLRTMTIVITENGPYSSDSHTLPKANDIQFATLRKNLASMTFGKRRYLFNKG